MSQRSEKDTSEAISNDAAAAAESTDGATTSNGTSTMDFTKAAWEWNIDLTSHIREEAQRYFQNRVKQTASSTATTTSHTPTSGGVDETLMVGDTRKSATIDHTRDVETGDTTFSGEDQDGQQQKQQSDDLPYCRQYRNLLPPHRPRDDREQYRFSALEYDHDVALIPPSDPEDIARALPAALARERLFEQGVFSLFRKRIWNYRDLDYSKDHPWAGSAGTIGTITPDSWAEDENEKGKPWPHGTPYDAEVIQLCWNFFLFVYNKYRTLSIKVIMCQVVISFVSPATSYLFGTGLIDELNEDTATGQTKKERAVRTCGYALAIGFLNIFAGYLTVWYKNNIPVGGVRTNLRDALFRRMQNLQSPLKDKLTPGAASGIIVDKVTSAVGIYYSILTFPSLVTGILAHVAVSLSSVVRIKYSHLVSLPTIIVVILGIITPILINLWYQPEYCILTRLEHQWMIRLRSIAGSAIPRSGRSYTVIHSPSNNDEEPKKRQTSIDEETQAPYSLPQVFHETAWLQTMRHWQSWKFSVIIVFVIQIVSQLGIVIVTICAGYAVIAGQGITVGNFSTLISSVTSILTLGSSVGGFITNLYDSHMMLKQISCIMNDDDISFDGGTDHFKTVEKLRLPERISKNMRRKKTTDSTSKHGSEQS